VFKYPGNCIQRRVWGAEKKKRDGLKGGLSKVQRGSRSMRRKAQVRFVTREGGQDHGRKGEGKRRESWGGREKKKGRDG